MVIVDNGYIDLHVHSNYSDGKHSLQFIADKAVQNNVSVIAFAEHYNMSSFFPFRRLVGKQIEVLPAIEMGASLSSFGLSKNHVCHIVAYFPTTQICSILDYYELSREKCVKKTLDRLRHEGINLSYRTVVKHARDKLSVGRFDIAIALAKLGYAPTPAKAYSKFLDLNSPIYVDREKMQVETLIKSILLCKGLPVLAHPRTLRLNNSDTTELIAKLKSYGLVGIEVFNPHNRPDHIQFYSCLCDEYGLIKTVGSDYHGRSKEGVELGLGIDGNLKIDDYSIVTALKQKEKQLFY